MAMLNRATQAWVEREYHHHLHDEIKQTPTERWLAGPSVGRPCSASDDLRRAFRMELQRKQRLSDGTLTALGVRYEVPSAYRTLVRPTVRVARWDLSSIDLVDPRRGTHLATLYPLDKERNADRRRRALADPSAAIPTPPARAGVAPLLRQLMAEYAATGLPPAYVPHHQPPFSLLQHPLQHRHPETATTMAVRVTASFASTQSPSRTWMTEAGTTPLPQTALL